MWDSAPCKLRPFKSILALMLCKPKPFWRKLLILVIMSFAVRWVIHQYQNFCVFWNKNGLQSPAALGNSTSVCWRTKILRTDFSQESFCFSYRAINVFIAVAAVHVKLTTISVLVSSTAPATFSLNNKKTYFRLNIFPFSDSSTSEGLVAQ